MSESRKRSVGVRPVQALCEPLEGRQLLSAAAPVGSAALDAGGVLRIAGTSKSEYVSLQYRYNRHGRVVADVVYVGTAASPTPPSFFRHRGAGMQVRTLLGTFRVSDITAVDVRLGNGNDSFRVIDGVLNTQVKGWAFTSNRAFTIEADGTVTRPTLITTVPITVLGGNGNDSLAGGEGIDRIEGGSGNDLIAGNGGSDDLLGQDGSDTVAGGGGTDTVDGGDGDDNVSGDGGVVGDLVPAGSAGSAAGDTIMIDTGGASYKGIQLVVAPTAGDVVRGGAGTDRFHKSDTYGELDDLASEDRRA